MTEIDEAVQKVLLRFSLSRLRSPTTNTLIKVGVDFFSSHGAQGLRFQTELVAQHRPADLDTYFNGLLEAGVPPHVVDAQRERSEQRESEIADMPHSSNNPGPFTRPPPAH